MSSKRTQVSGEGGKKYSTHTEDEANHRILLPSCKHNINPAEEILKFSDHITWLENHTETKFGEY